MPFLVTLDTKHGSARHVIHVSKLPYVKKIKKNVVPDKLTTLWWDATTKNIGHNREALPHKSKAHPQSLDSHKGGECTGIATENTGHLQQ